MINFRKTVPSQVSVTCKATNHDALSTARMLPSPPPASHSRLAKFVGFALVKNRQLRRDAEALRSALFPAHAFVPASTRRALFSGVRSRAADPSSEGAASALAPPSSRAMRDAEVYLETLGVPAGLPVLTLAFRGRGVAPGERLSARRDAFLNAEPTARLPDHLAAEKPPRSVDVLLAIDPDAPAPRSEGRRHLPGASGPYLHGLWIRTPRRNPVEEEEKEGEKDEPSDIFSLRAVVPYRPPAPPAGGGEHRYVFLAFEGEFDPASRWARPEEAIAASVAKGRARWDAEAFARENASTLKPVAATFFRCAALD